MFFIYQSQLPGYNELISQFTFSKTALPSAGLQSPKLLTQLPSLKESSQTNATFSELHFM